MTIDEKQKAIDALKISAPVMVTTQEEFYDYIHTLNKIIDWIEQEPCEDCVSRQAALDAMCALCNTGETLKENPWRDNPHIDAIIDALDNLPPITPQPKTGHWIEVDTNMYACSNCGHCFSIVPEDNSIKQYHYCPNCGARMFKPHESEE